MVGIFNRKSIGAIGIWYARDTPRFLFFPDRKGKTWDGTFEEFAQNRSIPPD